MSKEAVVTCYEVVKGRHSGLVKAFKLTVPVATLINNLQS